MASKIVLFGGPAGAGKTTIAREWCAKRSRAAHIELDDIRGLIVSGLADPQQGGAVQDGQYELSVEAVCNLAATFADAGYDVALDDVFEPDAFERYWRQRLEDRDWQLVILLPSLGETMKRSLGRTKRVLEMHTREQHRRSAKWPSSIRIDTTSLSVEASLALVNRMIDPSLPSSDAWV